MVFPKSNVRELGLRAFGVARVMIKYRSSPFFFRAHVPKTCLTEATIHIFVSLIRQPGAPFLTVRFRHQEIQQEAAKVPPVFQGIVQFEPVE